MESWVSVELAATTRAKPEAGAAAVITAVVVAATVVRGVGVRTIIGPSAAVAAVAPLMSRLLPCASRIYGERRGPATARSLFLGIAAR